MYFNDNCCRQQPGMPQMHAQPTAPTPWYPIPQQQMPTFPLPPVGTAYPTGIPTGPSAAPIPMPAQTGMPAVTPTGEPTATTTTEGLAYTPGFLRTQIGRKVRFEFLIGTNSTTDRTGTLVGVGASYILLRLEETDDIMLGDLYSIKFATFYY